MINPSALAVSSLSVEFEDYFYPFQRQSRVWIGSRGHFSIPKSFLSQFNTSSRVQKGIMLLFLNKGQFLSVTVKYDQLVKC